MAEDGRERFADEDTGITWVDFTDVIRNATAGEGLGGVAGRRGRPCSFPRTCAWLTPRRRSCVWTRVLCAELGKGQMLHADSFNLGDSMSALEMMDPKMDAGVINEKNKSTVPAGQRFALFAWRPSGSAKGTGRLCRSVTFRLAAWLSSAIQTSVLIVGS
jgi:hypothetical protein